MKILLVTQYFWPERFQINDLILGLQERGHEITILTGKPNYPEGKFYDGYTFNNKRTEEFNGMKIYRSRLIPRRKGGGLALMLNYFSFVFFGSIRAFGIKEKQFDKIFVFEVSPITVGLVAIVAKRRFKAPIYFWVQDLWPDSIAAAGGLSNKHALKVMDLITRYIYKHSDKILVQSKAFMPPILKQGVPREKLIFYPNSTDSFYKVLPPEEEYKSQLPEGPIVMYAGNIGNAQSFETLVSAAKTLKDNNVKVSWVILGDGRQRVEIEKSTKELGLEDVFIFLGSKPGSLMPHYFACADALIVSLKKTPIFATTIPSKVQSYMACGRPLLLALDGEGAKVVKEAKAGLSVGSEDTLGLAKMIEEFLLLPKQDKINMGIAARKYFDENFERELLLGKLEEIFNE